MQLPYALTIDLQHILVTFLWHLTILAVWQWPCTLLIFVVNRRKLLLESTHSKLQPSLEFGIDLPEQSGGHAFECACLVEAAKAICCRFICYICQLMIHVSNITVRILKLNSKASLDSLMRRR
jgi:hypothetical protein